MPDVQQLVNPRIGNGRIDEVRLAFLRWLASGDARKESLIRTYRDYYDGEHATQLTARMRAFLSIAANIEFNLNFMPIPVDVLKERMTVVGFDAAAPQGGEEGIFWQWWQVNRMDGVQKGVHLANFRDGDTFVIVGWDNERNMPTFDHNLAYDGTSGVRVFYQEEDRHQVDYAFKLWRIEEEDLANAGYGRRLNVYTADAIYKYRSDSRFAEGAWGPVIETDGAGNQLPWPIPWVGEAGQPLGVAVVPFRNNPCGYTDGTSELHDLIPVQNALNKLIVDELMAADVESFGMITKAGGGDPASITVAPRSILYDPDPETTWDQIPASDFAGIRALVKDYIMRIAQISRTPLSYFQVTGQISSSETQKADDTGLVSKAEDRSVDIGNSWEDCMILARRLHNAFAEGPELDEGERIETQWASFERVDKLQTEERRSNTALNLVKAGATPRGAFKAAGYNDEQVTELVGSRLLRQDEV